MGSCECGKSSAALFLCRSCLSANFCSLRCQRLHLEKCTDTTSRNQAEEHGLGILIPRDAPACFSLLMRMEESLIEKKLLVSHKLSASPPPDANVMRELSEEIEKDRISWMKFFRNKDNFHYAVSACRCLGYIMLNPGKISKAENEVVYNNLVEIYSGIKIHGDLNQHVFWPLKRPTRLHSELVSDAEIMNLILTAKNTYGQS